MDYKSILLCYYVEMAALLQTFPMTYKFFEDEENVSLVKVSRYIGNAVPPVLGEVVAESILKHLGNYYN